MAGLEYYLEMMYYEGEQADAYKARKAKEAKDKKFADEARLISRYKKADKSENRREYKSKNIKIPSRGVGYNTPGDRYTKSNPKGIVTKAKGKVEDDKRKDKAEKMVSNLDKRHVYGKNDRNPNEEMMTAYDAANRHLRRRSKNESAIFNPELI